MSAFRLAVLVLGAGLAASSPPHVVCLFGRKSMTVLKRGSWSGQVECV